MILLNLLRMLVDLAFYGTFASVLASYWGGTGAITGYLLQCVFFALSSLGNRRRWFRVLLVSPVFLSLFFYRRHAADCLFLLPGTVYILILVWKNDYILQHVRQYSLFQTYWKLFLILIPFFVIFDATEMFLSVIMPYGLFMVIPSVLLMQMLRHDKAVYSNPSYQMMNYTVIAILSAVALLLSRQAFLNSCRTVIRFLYKLLLRPILLLLSVLLECLIWVFFQFASILFGDETIQMAPMASIQQPAAEQIWGEVTSEVAQNPWLTVILWILFGLIVSATALFFFRYLNGRGTDKQPETAAEELRIATHYPVKRIGRKKESNELQKVRSQYRQFLKWRIKHGVLICPHNTSLDVHQQISPAQEELSSAIRELYIRVRYAGHVEKDDAKQMKIMLTQIKRSIGETETTP